jgi:hypothetical protein
MAYVDSHRARLEEDEAARRGFMPTVFAIYKR